jgi:RNA 2',3'-cyclic 3'-phosphodiesterase
MQEQLDLMGFEPEPQSLHTLFFALTLDANIGTQVVTLREQLIEEHGLTGTPVGAQLLHVTLLDLGLFAEHKVDIARKAAEVVAATTRHLDILFDCAMSFAGGGALVLAGSGDGNVSLAALRQNLEVAMRKLGLRANPIKTPHLTLMYGNRISVEHPIEPIRWKAEKFVLIRSHVGDTLHEPLGTWPTIDH